MHDRIDAIIIIIAKYQQGSLSSEEHATLQEWLAEDEEHRELYKILMEDNKIDTDMELFATYQDPAFRDKLIAIAVPGKETKKSSGRRVVYYAVAAAFLLAMAGCIWYFYTDKQNKPQHANTPVYTDTAQPDLSKYGFITKDNGSILPLARDGYLDSQGNYSIYKDKDTISYKGNNAAGTKRNMFNIVSASLGTRYLVKLPDGSKSLLNATAAIKFGVTTDNLRNVDVKGEIGFEIITDKQKPFIVNLYQPNDKYLGKLEVKGTVFNVDLSDNDESGKITLLRGSLKVFPAVTNEAMNTFRVTELKPGQQAQLWQGEIKVVDGVDTTAIFAWQKGELEYKSISTRKLLGKLEKWFRVDIDYKLSTIVDCDHHVTIPPDMTFEAVLAGMKLQCPQLKIIYKQL